MHISEIGRPFYSVRISYIYIEVMENLLIPKHTNHKTGHFYEGVCSNLYQFWDTFAKYQC